MRIPLVDFEDAWFEERTRADLKVSVAYIQHPVVPSLGSVSFAMLEFPLVLTY